MGAFLLRHIAYETRAASRSPQPDAGRTRPTILGVTISGPSAHVKVWFGSKISHRAFGGRHYESRCRGVNRRESSARAVGHEEALLDEVSHDRHHASGDARR